MATDNRNRFRNQQSPRNLSCLQFNHSGQQKNLALFVQIFLYVFNFFSFSLLNFEKFYALSVVILLLPLGSGIYGLKTRFTKIPASVKLLCRQKIFKKSIKTTKE